MPIRFPTRFNAQRLWSTLALTCALCFAAQTLLATATDTPAPAVHATLLAH